ncbi:ADP-ribose pyrophosphatase [Sphaerisporangium siamense]|uniref:8-oxo-dGTP pyrophosphatase MutT (NUDIX family) n=1 Tax=Sphaerisporangium siamense TaxID=795645 RepID=A0A7W7DAV5_9ACTN|nr:NUDIX domain-containing protein [Sphaerisporangium siamense]MBB4701988.1 8-oxo-dGTP pyrophosphatase MutT (NUDIX family) [Sphaerisporangium siamense]GII84100.1 ADP-ribose pyrophosphatase [Sphaerisporangium siamense]
MTTSDRPAARVVCVDGQGRVLLMRWRDAVSGRVFWEPPGGGIDSGEGPLEAARRELAEETGLPGDAVIDMWVPVARDYHWLGVHYVKVEPFYLARFPGTPPVTPAALTHEEVDTFLGHAWHTLDEIAALDDAVEPPTLTEVVRLLRDPPTDLGRP